MLKRLRRKLLRAVLAMALLPLVLLLGILVAYSAYVGVYLRPVFREYGGASCLTDARRNAVHTDYLWGMLKIPWKDTVLCGLPPPVQDGGNQNYRSWEPDGPPKPIPLDGQWQWSHLDVRLKSGGKRRLYYLAVTWPNHYHQRIGVRWDDKDHLYFPTLVLLKKLPYNWGVKLFYRELHRHQA